MPTNKTDIKTQKFIDRLVEIGETNQPAELAQRMDISYQAARNYLNGRLPETNVLMSISEKTKCSIHWLLTGKGEKIISARENLNTLILPDQIKTFIRQECLKIFDELFTLPSESVQPEQIIGGQKIIKLASDKIRLEAVKDKSTTFSE